MNLRRGIEIAGRRLLSWGLARLTGGLRPWPPQLRTVIIIRIDDRVGDLLLTTPLVTALRTLDPPPAVHLVAAAGRSSLVEGWPALSGLHDFDRHWITRAPRRLFGLIRTLRRLRADLCIDASHWHTPSFTSAALARACAAAHTLGHDRGPRIHDSVTPEPDPALGEVHAKLTLLAPAKIDPAAASSQMYTTAGTDPPPLDTSGAAVLVPGARKHDHRAPAEAFIAAAEALQARGLRTLVVYGPGDEVLAADVAQRSHSTLAPPTTLDEMAALFRGAVAAVTNDSGPMHLAAAVGTPCLSLFVKGDPARWAPKGPQHHSVWAETPSDATSAVQTLLASGPVGHPGDPSAME